MEKDDWIVPLVYMKFCFNKESYYFQFSFLNLKGKDRRNGTEDTAPGYTLLSYSPDTRPMQYPVDHWQIGNGGWIIPFP